MHLERTVRFFIFCVLKNCEQNTKIIILSFLEIHNILKAI